MAGDILLYQADIVPIGDDQRQHLELARDIAERFNSRFGEMFVVPDGVYPEVGARIMDLQEPTRKMSTTGGTPQGTIGLLDEPDVIRKKFRSAVTDSGREVRRADDKPGVVEPDRHPLGRLRAHARGDRGRSTATAATASSSRTSARPSSSCSPRCRSATRSSARTRASCCGCSRSGADKARAASAPTLERMYEAMGFVRL